MRFAGTRNSAKASALTMSRVDAAVWKSASSVAAIVMAAKVLLRILIRMVRRRVLLKDTGHWHQCRLRKLRRSRAYLNNAYTSINAGPMYGPNSAATSNPTVEAISFLTALRQVRLLTVRAAQEDFDEQPGEFGCGHVAFSEQRKGDDKAKRANDRYRNECHKVR